MSVVVERATSVVAQGPGTGVGAAVLAAGVATTGDAGGAVGVGRGVAGAAAGAPRDVVAAATCVEVEVLLLVAAVVLWVDGLA